MFCIQLNKRVDHWVLKPYTRCAIKLRLNIVLQEDVARKLEVFTFVMHAPSDYFHNKRAPYRFPSTLISDDKYCHHALLATLVTVKRCCSTSCKLLNTDIDYLLKLSCLDVLSM